MTYITVGKENGKGDFKYFHPNGEIWKTGEMVNGKESGLWTYYYDNGVKSSEGRFTNGLRDGEYNNLYTPPQKVLPEVRYEN